MTIAKKRIYYTLQIDNNYREKGSEEPILAETTINTVDFLKHQQDYNLTVTSFELYGVIPIMLFPILENTNPNINDSIYGVCISYDGNDYPQRVIYDPDNNYILPNAPVNNGGKQDFSTNYYNVYTFEKIAALINTALFIAYGNFNAVHGGVHGTPPWIIYDKGTGLFSLIAEFSYSLAGAAKIHFNVLLIQLFDNFRYVFNSYDESNFKACEFIIENKYNTNAYAIKGATIPAPPLNPDYLEMCQEYDTRYLFSNIKSIFFTSNSIQTRPEYLPFGQANSFNPNIKNILASFDILYESGKISWREVIYYIPFVYKWVNLVSNQSLNRLQLSINLLLFNGDVIPFYIPSNKMVNVKLLFEEN